MRLEQRRERETGRWRESGSRPSKVVILKSRLLHFVAAQFVACVAGCGSVL